MSNMIKKKSWKEFRETDYYLLQTNFYIYLGML